MAYSFFTSKDTGAAHQDLHSNDIDMLSTFIKTSENSEILHRDNGHIDFNSLTVDSSKKNELIDYALEKYTIKLKKLQTVDFKLALSLSLGAIAIPLSPLMLGFGALVSMAAFFYAGTVFQQRKSVQEEYKKAQSDMTAVYIWVMNDEGVNLDDSKIKAMQSTFDPMLSDRDIKDYLHETVEEGVIDQRNEDNTKAIENESTTKLQLSLNYLLYGQDQGSLAQVSKGLLALCGQTILSVGVSIKEGVVSLIDSEAVQSVRSTFSSSNAR